MNQPSDDPAPGDGEPSGDVRDQEAKRERELVIDCLLGNKKALGRLVTEYQEPITAGAAQALTKAAGPVSATMEDLAQAFILEVLTNPWPALRRFDNRRGGLGPWLTGVAFRWCSHMLRSKDVRWPGPGLVQNPSAVDGQPARPAARGDADALFACVLEKLSDSQRAVLQARLPKGIDGPRKSGTEIAKDLGISKNKVYDCLARIVRRIHRMTKEEDFDWEL